MKIAILGTGMIVKEAMAAIKQTDRWELAAIFARPRSKDKGEALAAEFGVPKVYTDYDELLKDEEIDFVYVGLVNSAHYQYAKDALMAGKNVICEKPFTSTAAEAAELASLANEKKLFLFEAVTLLHLPNFAAVKENLTKIGRVRLIQANYSQYSSRYDKYLAGSVAPAFDPMLSGGALYDINIYNLNFIIALFGRPAAVDYFGHIGFSGADTSGAAVLRYGGFTAVSVGAKDSASPCFIIIQGEKGYIRVEGAPNELKSVEVCAEGEITRHENNKHAHRMVHEFEEFADVYEKGDFATMALWLTTSVQVMDAAELLRKSAGIKFAADGKEPNEMGD